MKTEKSLKIHPITLLIIAFVGVAALLGAYRLVSGNSLGLRSFFTDMVSSGVKSVKLLWNSSTISRDSQGNYTNIIFLHHSTGNNLVQQGQVREIFGQNGYAFWDHGFNRQGLRGRDKKISGFNYKVPNDNTDPDGLAHIFAQKAWPIPVNTLSALLQHEVIVIKSCFEPANHIRSDSQLDLYKQYYRGMRDVMDQHPDHIFIVVTTPPLNPAETTPEEAERAREYANWLKSDEFLAGHPNIFTFDFYELLAEDDPSNPEANMLRSDYRDGTDSHPNKTANQAIGPIFANFIMEKVDFYRTNAAAD
jgi:hypothetical protein